MEEKHYVPAGAIVPYCSGGGLKKNIVVLGGLKRIKLWPAQKSPHPILFVTYKYVTAHNAWWEILKHLRIKKFKKFRILLSCTVFWNYLESKRCMLRMVLFFGQPEHIPPGVSKIKYVRNWPSAVFDLSRSRNIGKYRKLAKYWQITPRAEQMAWTGGFLSFPQGSFHLAEKTFHYISHLKN